MIAHTTTLLPFKTLACQAPLMTPRLSLFKQKMPLIRIKNWHYQSTLMWLQMGSIVDSSTIFLSYIPKCLPSIQCCPKAIIHLILLFMVLKVVLQYSSISTWFKSCSTMKTRMIILVSNSMIGLEICNTIMLTSCFKSICMATFFRWWEEEMVHMTARSNWIQPIPCDEILYQCLVKVLLSFDFELIILVLG